MKWLPWLIFALFGFFLVGNNFSAKLGMIDDHEIPYFLGSDGKVSLLEIPKLLSATEIGRFGQALRYRPTYYTLRIIETALWRDNAFLWYGARYLLFVVSMYLLWRVLVQFFPKIIAYLVVLFTFTYSFWSDIMTRLGPGEIYTVLGLVMFTFGFIKIWQGDVSKLWVMAVGYFLCVGSKENFVILLPILLVLVGYRVYHKNISIKEKWAYLICIAFTFLIIAEIVIATGAVKTDIYGAQISYRERLVTLYSYKRFIVESNHMLPAMIAAALYGIIWLRQVFKKGLSKACKTPIISHLIILAVIGITIASQYLFYNNTLPTRMRYDFPGMLMFRLFDLVVIHLIISTLPSTARGNWLKKIIYVGLFGYLIFSIYTIGYDPTRNRSMANAQGTNGFDVELTRTTQALRENPQIPLIIISRNYNDYEPIDSISRYLLAKRITNKLMLDFVQPDLDKLDPLGQELVPVLISVVEKGGKPGSFYGISPLVIPSPNETCFSISFGPTSDSSCTNVANF